MGYTCKWVVSETPRICPCVAMLDKIQVWAN
nr:MAG TPA: hypothetical protein [Caudoviricetes sp.]